MSVTATTGTTATLPNVTTRPTGSLRRTTVVAGLGAAAVTAGIAAVVHTAGVSFKVGGKMIAPLGFAEVTFLGAVIGGLLVVVLNRSSRPARRRFLQVAVALTVLSFAAPLAWADDAGSKVAFVALHVVAAAIVIPALARRAHD